jgi:non-heme chloroperoxidase
MSPNTITAPRFATMPLATGVRLHYAEGGEPGGEAIVFLHGYTDSWFSFSRILPLLPDGYHVYALDQRGHGDSERPASGYTIDDLAADAVAFLDALGIERAVLVGHSMGSMVARRVAQCHPERVARLVLVGPILLAVNEAIQGLAAVVNTLTDPVPHEFVREFQAGTAHVPLPEPFLDRVVAESLKLPAHVWKGALDGQMTANDLGQLARIAAPTLILWGERDALFPRADQEHMAAAIPDARLVIYAETGHSLHWERPEQFAADLEAFIRRA